jgi:ParB/RepB/Spo0J family partition protein
MPKVAISDIRPNPVALRAVDRDSEAYTQLRDSVADEAIGLINPISVREQSEEVEGETITYYEIVDGLHRYTACCEAGYEEIDVNLKSYAETEAHLAQIIGNAIKVETKPVEYTKGLARVISSNPTWTMTDLATRVHRSPAWLNQRFGLLKLNSVVQEIVDDGNITVSNAVILAKLPHDEQVNYVDQAMTMPTTEFGPLVQSRVREIRAAEKEGRAAGKPEFSPNAKCRKKAELEDELKNRTVLAAIVSDCENASEAAYLALQWVLNVDPMSVEVQRAAWEERQQKLEEEKAARAAARAKKKADEAIAASAKAQEEAEAKASA